MHNRIHLAGTKIYMNITWRSKKFDELTLHELYAIIKLRNAVFVVEQSCVFQDADDKDQFSWHVMGWTEHELAAYTRLVPAGISYNESSIGRVVTSSKHRGMGVGRELMKKSIEILYSLWGRQPIRIGAQLHLKDFYGSLGFNQSSDVYIEDGIEHIEMILL